MSSSPSYKREANISFDSSSFQDLRSRFLGAALSRARDDYCIRNNSGSDNITVNDVVSFLNSRLSFNFSFEIIALYSLRKI